MTKTRLDKLVFERGLAPSRERAQALIIGGQIIVGDHTVDKPGHNIDDQAKVRLKGEPMPYVSRGGLKLAHALDRFSIDVTELRGLDVGASTGGFTDVLLQRGASAVCALDVGYGQLAWKLRQDARVICRERINVRDLDVTTLPFAPDIVVCDVSFISLRLVLPKLIEAGKQARTIICLIKPQFEVGKGELGKGGVVRDEAQRLEVVENITNLARTLGCAIIGVETSPITGPAGNVEYLLALRPPL